MAAEVGVAIAIEATMVLAKKIAGEVKEHRKQLEKAKRYLSDPILIIDEATLQTILDIAKDVDRNPAILTERKEALKAAHDQAYQDLQAVDRHLGEWLDANNETLSYLKRRTALGNLDEKSRSFKDALGRFKSLAESLQKLDPVAAHKLEETEFEFLPGYERQTGRPFVHDAKLHIDIPGFPKKEYKVYVECRRYKNDFEGKDKNAEEQTDKHLEDLRDKNVEMQRMVLLNQNLAKANHAVGIPQVLGFRDEPPRGSKDHFGAFQLIMRIPGIDSNFGSTSLQSYITRLNSQPSLNDRINLCVQLAEAVFQVHKMSIVHKNIRPENILVIPPKRDTVPTGQNIASPPQETSGIRGELYLVGWQSARRLYVGLHAGRARPPGIS
ncbi:hypothetical protein Daus18300_003463 [Diaporthe australafricana]|uniref:Protein kinase domain-containing protein n=1 Tax=Diaporthe australafricana TaxID=127596 RepID=A0ABR3XF84_9PEZI